MNFCRDGNELSTRDLQKMVQALPQYTEQMEKISLHVEVGFDLIMLWYVYLLFLVVVFRADYFAGFFCLRLQGKLTELSGKRDFETLGN